MNYLTTVQFGTMRLLGEFLTERADWSVQDRCLVRSDRGVELGRILRSPRRLRFGRDGAALSGEVLRPASPRDLERWEQIRNRTLLEEEATIRDLIRTSGLPLELVAVEHLILGDHLLVYVDGPHDRDLSPLAEALAQTFGRENRRLEIRYLGRDVPIPEGGCGRPDCPKSEGKPRRCDS